VDHNVKTGDRDAAGGIVKRGVRGAAQDTIFKTEDRGAAADTIFKQGTEIQL
jgi:hypothetical protein